MGDQIWIHSEDFVYKLALELENSEKDLNQNDEIQNDQNLEEKQEGDQILLPIFLGITSRMQDKNK